MSTFYRKGTVSKASGPIHSNSYAMRGVPVRYKAPIFVPELLQLPSQWSKPSLPSSLAFTYDYSLERKVSEQARLRAISIAAEASLQRKQIAALRKQEEEEQQAVGVASSETAPPQATPQPLLLLSSDILTPTPVAPPTSQSSPAVGNGEALGNQQSSSEGGSSTSLIEEDSKPAAGVSDQTNKSEAVLKSLGNWSIKEFEGDTMDPFEITSLQAINDMEVLQSVLQPTKLPVVTSASSPGLTTSQSQVPASLTASQPAQSSPALSPAVPPTTQNVGSLPRTSNSSPELRHSSNSNSTLFGTSHFTPQNVPVVSTNPFLSDLPAISTAVRTSNPFLSSEPVASNPSLPFPPMTAPTQQQPKQQQPTILQQPQERSQSEPGVGTLVNLHEEHPKPPVPVPRTSPKIHHGSAPVPKPRKGSPAPQTRGVAQPTTTVNLPTLPPKGIPPSSVAAPPAAATRGAGSSSPRFSSGISMGVAVLPPIGSAAAPLPPRNEPPPTYQPQATSPPTGKASPPPPYSSPASHRQQPHAPALTPPTVPRKTYILPNPEASLTNEQRKQVATIAGMGFPPQRVGRAILRYEDDQTKVLDFLFLVGALEDAKFNGNSAETALVACEEDLEKAKEYLQQLEVYKEIGFQEKAIHEAYTKSAGDWDKALDVLTKSR